MNQKYTKLDKNIKSLYSTLKSLTKHLNLICNQRFTKILIYDLATSHNIGGNLFLGKLRLIKNQFPRLGRQIRQTNNTYKNNQKSKDEMILDTMEEWSNDYNEIVEDLPEILESYKVLNSNINSYGLVNNPYSRLYVAKKIKDGEFQEDF